MNKETKKTWKTHLWVVYYIFVSLSVIMLTLGIMRVGWLLSNENSLNSYLPALTEANFLYFVSPFLGLSTVFFAIGSIAASLGRKKD